jgi:cleavage stimulation factor subunit 2
MVRLSRTLPRPPRAVPNKHASHFTDSAASAVRNLDDYEIMGRKLRVDFSNETVGDEDGRERNQAVGAYLPFFESRTIVDRGHIQTASSSNAPSSYNQPANGTTNQGAMPPSGSSLPPLPQGKDLPAGMTCTDSISRTLNTLPPAQLLDTLQQVQQFATQDPARLTELFNQSPQLTYAIFQAMLLMGLVSPDAINSVLDNPGAPLPAPAGGAPPYGYPGATGTPPVPVGSGYGAPPVVPSPVPAAAPPAPAPAGQDPEALMRAVMELPQETIDQLPEAERQQIMALRASFGMGQRH